MIDTHAHIYLDQFTEDLEEVIGRALAAGVKKILLPNIDQTTIEEMLRLEEKYPKVCYAMMGLHPCSVGTDYQKQLEIVAKWLKERNFLALGEIGTDLYWDKTYWKEQQEAFKMQCELAIVHNLPIVIHCRETIAETIELVKPYRSDGLKGVFHCFTGTVEQAKQISNMGFYLGLGGVSTFKNGGQDQVIPAIDPNQILLETDSPYLAPVPYRGKRNEPAYLDVIAEKVAAYLSITKDDLIDVTTRNANRLFFS